MARMRGKIAFLHNSTGGLRHRLLLRDNVGGTGASTAFAIAEETIAGLVGADLPEMRKNA